MSEVHSVIRSISVRRYLVPRLNGSDLWRDQEADVQIDGTAVVLAEEVQQGAAFSKMARDDVVPRDLRDSDSPALVGLSAGLSECDAKKGVA
jgi:hypothetical protein